MNKKLLKVLLAISFIILIFLLVNIKNIGTSSLYKTVTKFFREEATEPINTEEKSAPEFYGTVGINLRVGDTLDLENSMFRIFAKDYYDGDLTHSITVKESNVKTDVIGNYKIVYSVKNSQQVETEIEVPVIISGDGERTITRKLYTTKYGWNTKTNQGYGNKGVDHDRQHLGIYVKAGGKLKIRQTQESYSEDNKVIVDILNNDRNTEALGIVINTTNENINNWQEIVIENNSVPFINTIDTKEVLNQEIEICIEDAYSENSKIKELTYFLEGDSESKFINKWNGNQDKLSLIESDRITLLVPIEDMSIITGIINNTNTASFKYPFTSLADLFMYYDNVFEFYDELIGLDFNAAEEIDKNERTKFFVKADKNGSGLAYYSGKYTGQNSESISEYLQKTWGSLHEIGHGYEGDIGKRDINLTEAQNNIFAYYFQQTYLESEDYGWLGSISVKEERWNEQRRNIAEEESFNSLLSIASENGIDKNNTRLYAIVNLLNKTGLTESMSTLYKDSRRDHYNNEGLTKEADLIAKSFSEASGYNVVPYLEAWHIDVSDNVKEEIENKGYPIVYFLRDLVTETNAKTIKNARGLEGIYSLVTEAEISDYITNKKGTVVFPFDNEFYNFFSNSEIIIKKGISEVNRINITNKSLSLELPVGLYRIEITNTNLILKQQYVNVQEDGTIIKTLAMKIKNFDQIVDDSGNAIITKYYGDDTQVEIPEKIYKYDVVGIDEKAFKDNMLIQELTIPTTVIGIGKQAFQNCVNLTTVKDLSNVASIGERAFDNCTSLTTLENLTNVSEIGKYAFYKCSNLESAINLKNITEIGEFTFYLCKKLPDIGDLSNVTTIGKWAFSNCKSLTTEVDLTKVITLGELAFDNCNNLMKVEIGKNITSIGNKAFYLCNDLTIYGYGDTIAYTYANDNNINFIDRGVQRIVIKTAPSKVQYFIGEALDTTGLVVQGITENGETKIIEDNITCTPTTIGAAGTQAITVTYGGKTTTFEVTVNAIELSSIAVKTKPSKITYYVGDTLNTAGLVLTGTNNNGSTKEITTGITCTPTTLNTAGKQTITITYQGKTTTFEVTVNAIELSSIAVKTKPSKLTYYVGDILSTAGLVLTGTNNNGSTKEITTGFTCTPTTLGAAGKQTVTVTYGGKTTTFEVTVNAIELSSIAVKTKPSKLTYYVGDTLNTSGLVLTGTNNNGTTKEITTGFTCTPTTLGAAGKQTITITYQGKTTTFEVTVNAIELSSIAVKTKPSKVTYYVGDTLNTSGLVLTGTNNNGSTKEITTGFTCTPTTLSTAGKQVVTVTYEGKTTTFEVTVNAIELSSIAVKTKPSKLTYYVGDTLSTAGLVLTGTNNNGSTKEITTGITCTPTTLNTAGKQVVTVTYGGKTTTFEVSVNKKTIDMSGVIFENKTVTYNGQEQKIEIQGQLPEGVKVTYEGNNKIIAGTYEVTAKFEVNTEIYNEISNKKATLTIEKAIPQYQKPTNVTATYGDILENIKLQTGFKWDNLSMNVGEVGLKTFTATYTPEDTMNFKIVPGINIEVNVQKANPTVNPIYDTTKPIYIVGTLPEIKLSEGDTEGQITWDEYELEIGTNKYRWTFIPNDIKNYNVKTGMISFEILDKLTIGINEYQVDKEKGFIKNIMPETTLQQLTRKINTNGKIELYKNGQRLSEDSMISTGMIIKISLNNEEVEYKTVVTGDLDGNAQMNEIDLLMLVRFKVGLYNQLKNEYLEAANIFKDENIADDKDVLKMVRVLVDLDTL